jgi:ParB-like chromosome segregation protein Spo0J
VIPVTLIIAAPEFPFFVRIHPMIKIVERKFLSLSEIDLTDDRFKFTEPVLTDDFKASVRDIGILQPPAVVLRGRTWVLVSGWKRILACRELGVKFVPVCVLDSSGDIPAFLWAVEENLAVRELSILEKAKVLARLRKFGLSAAEILKKMMPRLGIPPRETYLELYLAIDRLSPEAKHMINVKNLPIAVVQMLSGFSQKDITALLPVLRPLGQNKQRDFLEDLSEIARLRKISPRRILGNSEIAAILSNERWPAVQKSERVRAVVKRIRHPRLSAWEAEFGIALKKLGWPKEIGLEPRPFFEDDRMSVTFSFKNPDEFRRRVGRLNHLAADDQLRILWKHEKKPRTPRV